MKIDVKLLFMIALEIFTITTFSICTGSMLIKFFPEINQFVLIVLSLAGGYALTYAAFFILGILLGILAYTMLDEERREKFYDKYLRMPPEENQYDEYDEYYEEDTEQLDEPQIVLTATADEVSENKLGTYLDKEIPEWIKINGEKYIFSHVLTKNSDGSFMISANNIEEYDVIYPPGLIFRKEK